VGGTKTASSINNNNNYPILSDRGSENKQTMNTLPNIDRYKKDLVSLITRGGKLENAIQREFFPTKFDSLVK
jgi:hypothetical protein